MELCLDVVEAVFVELSVVEGSESVRADFGGGPLYRSNRIDGVARTGRSSYDEQGRCYDVPICPDGFNASEQ